MERDNLALSEEVEGEEGLADGGTERDRMTDTKSRCINAPARMSHPTKRYLPKDPWSHSFGDSKSASRGV